MLLPIHSINYLGWREKQQVDSLFFQQLIWQLLECDAREIVVALLLRFLKSTLRLNGPGNHWAMLSRVGNPFVAKPLMPWRFFPRRKKKIGCPLFPNFCILIGVISPWKKFARHTMKTWNGALLTSPAFLSWYL